MQGQTDFDLNRAIADWRLRLSQSPSYRAENLEELESHLRDSVAALVGKGLTEEEAFFIATRRVGPSCSLEPEFAKVNGREVWLGRLLWMLVGVQAWGLISAVSGTFSRTGSQLLIQQFMNTGYEFGSVGRMLVGIPIPAVPVVLFFLTDLVALMAITAGCWWLIRRNAAWPARWVGSRGGLLVGGATFCLAMLLCSLIGQLSSVWLARSAGPTTVGQIAISMSVANLALFALKTVALAVLTVLLARRQLRRASA